MVRTTEQTQATEPQSDLAGCRRCPRCNHLPDAQIDAETMRVTLECKRHGHMAIGDNLEQAARNWNTYLQAVAA